MSQPQQPPVYLTLAGRQRLEAQVDRYAAELATWEAATADQAEAEDRGDRYVVTNLRTGFANAAWLLQDDPERAAAEAEAGMGSWSKQGFHFQHFLDFPAVQIKTGFNISQNQMVIGTIGYEFKTAAHHFISQGFGVF